MDWRFRGWESVEELSQGNVRTGSEVAKGSLALSRRDIEEAFSFIRRFSVLGKKS